MPYTIPPPAKMEMDGDLRESWTLFKLTRENYAVATDIGKKNANVQIGTLLSVIGKECLQIYKNLPMSAEEQTDTQKILERLTNYFELKQNIIYQRYMFNSCTQEQGEKFDAYLIKLRHLIKTCEYGSLEDELLRDRIVIGTSNNNVRARLLSESGLTLNRAIFAGALNRQNNSCSTQPSPSTTPRQI